MTDAGCLLDTAPCDLEQKQRLKVRRTSHVAACSLRNCADSPISSLSFHLRLIAMRQKRISVRPPNRLDCMEIAHLQTGMMVYSKPLGLSMRTTMHVALLAWSVRK